MTRHERRGAIAVLVLLVMAVCIHLWVGRRPVPQPDGEMTARQQRFVQHSDSLRHLTGDDGRVVSRLLPGDTAVDYSADKTEVIPESGGGTSGGHHDAPKGKRQGKKDGGKGSGKKPQHDASRNMDPVPSF